MRINRFIIRKVILVLLGCFLSGNVLAQEVNLDRLTVEELNLYLDKAVKLSNTGKILTLSGIVAGATGFFVGAIITSNNPDTFLFPAGMGAQLIGVLVGIPCIIFGIPVWAVGDYRKTKAELTIQKFNISPEGSITFGLGITIRF